MTIAEFKKCGRLLKQAYAELESECLKQGIDPTSEQYDLLMSMTRQKILAAKGYTEEEYRAAKAEAEEEARRERSMTVEGVIKTVTELQEKVSEVGERHIPTEDEIVDIATKVAQTFVKAPVIEQHIVERTTIEKPKVVKETYHTTERVEYEDGPLYAELGQLRDEVEKLPKPKDVDLEPVKKELRDEFYKVIDVVQDMVKGMPDFRKLGVGLQAQIDTKIEGVNVYRIIYSATEPTDARINDIWISP